MQEVRYELVREFLSTRIDEKLVRSVFVAGSLPEVLKPGSDIDIFVVAHKETFDEFMNELEAAAQEFVEQHPICTYTFFRGPIKYEAHALLHFVIYTNGVPGIKEDFQNEPPQVFEGILRQYDVIMGCDPKEMKEKMDLSSNSHEQREEYMKRKAKEFFQQGQVTYRAWKNTSRWEFVPETITLDAWQRENLKKYFFAHEQE